MYKKIELFLMNFHTPWCLQNSKEPLARVSSLQLFKFILQLFKFIMIMEKYSSYGKRSLKVLNAIWWGGIVYGVVDRYNSLRNMLVLGRGYERMLTWTCYFVYLFHLPLIVMVSHHSQPLNCW